MIWINVWGLTIFAYITISGASAQNSRKPEQYDNGHGWDIRLAVPGNPGNDYPTLNAIPRTSFSCAGKEPGYYADFETDCQVFRVCTVGSTYGFQSFLCPNGTLFNQAVFVCDWWMNVNCAKAEQLFKSNNDKFGNLRLGPQLMKDIKKMLTHPMRNPYDKGAMKSNKIVMQEYKPPSGQLFPNSALIATPERIPTNVYVPPKYVIGQTNYDIYSSSDTLFGASTARPQFIPRDAEVFQKQKQNPNSQYLQGNNIQTTQSSQVFSSLSNGYGGHLTQSKNTDFISNNRKSPRPTQNYSKHIQQVQPYNSQNILANQRQQIHRENTHLINSNKLTKQNNGKTDFGTTFTKQFVKNYNAELDKQRYSDKSNSFPQFANNIDGQVGNEAKQNLVSTDVIPSTVITKTLTYSRIIQEPKQGTPKSRITFKTWIVKPAKSGRLIIEPTPYTYEKPTESTAEKLIADTSAYVYNRPKTTPQTERLVTESEEEPYVYNPPTVSAKQVDTTPKEPPRKVYLPPSTSRPTLSSPYVSQSTTRPTEASRTYLTPTTFKPAAQLYIPPTDATVLSEPLVNPSTSQQPAQYGRLISIANSTPDTDKPKEDKRNPLFSLITKSHINTNHNNLTFTDILTKEKLDITVNDIVKDTHDILKTASPADYIEFRQDPSSIELSEVNDSESVVSNDDSGEKLTASPPSPLPVSSRLIATPSTDLEPPEETYSVQKNANQLSNLPYFKEPASPTNTIERTVSLKITIPEKVAEYLFKPHNDTGIDNLEILNTGSSNYLVLTSKLTENPSASFIPLGKLIWNKHSNLSNSQALVNLFLADSLNAAKEYNNIAQQHIITPTLPTQTEAQNLNNVDIGQITNQISQLTSSQYSGNTQNNQYSNNLLALPQTTQNIGGSYRGVRNYLNELPQTQIPQNHRLSQNAALQQNTQEQLYSSLYQNSGNNYAANLQGNLNQVYSGQLYQLPVPDVTSHIYNSANLVQSANTQQTNVVRSANSHRDLNQNNDGVGNNNLGKRSNADVELVQSQNSPVPPTAIQLLPSTESSVFNTQDNFAKDFVSNFLNNGDGITAHIQDKIVGTIPHPLEDNKLVTYKKDQSYYVYTQLNNNNQYANGQVKNQQQVNANNNEQRLQSDVSNIVTYQLIPSVSYQLEDEREQQKLLNAFQIDQFGNPKSSATVTKLNANRKQDIVSDVDYVVEHPKTNNKNGQYNNINVLYNGPSSYSAPQASVGSLATKREILPNIKFSRIEKLDDDESNNGYSKVKPARQFTF